MYWKLCIIKLSFTRNTDIILFIIRISVGSHLPLFCFFILCLAVLYYIFEYLPLFVGKVTNEVFSFVLAILFRWIILVIISECEIIIVEVADLVGVV